MGLVPSGYVKIAIENGHRNSGVICYIAIEYGHRNSGCSH